jgi:hypothetical protein
MIPSIGSQIQSTFAGTSRPSSGARADTNDAVANKEPTSAANSTNEATSSSQSPVVSGAPFTPTTSTQQTEAGQSSRQDLVELEAVRVRFQLQREAQLSSGNRAVQEFLEVADFERREQLTSLVGLDIKV